MMVRTRAYRASNARSSIAPPSLEDLFHRLSQHDGEWLRATLTKRWEYLVEEEELESGASILQQSPLWKLDLTLPYIPAGLQVSKFVQDLRAWDWSLTKLGAMSTWSLDLRRMVNKCLHDEQATALWIGDEHLAFYNESYAIIIGAKHPQCLGKPYVDVWPEIETSVLGILDACQQDGTHYHIDKTSFLIEPHGRREEIWLSFTLTPIPDTGTGGVLGCYASVHYTTAREILSRRMSTLLTLGQYTAQALDAQDFWRQVTRGLEANLPDVPFAAVYSLAEDSAGQRIIAPGDHETASSASNSGHDDWLWDLTGTVGIPAGFEGLPVQLNAVQAAEMFTNDFAIALACRRALMLTTAENTFPSVLSGVVHSRVHGDPCDTAVLFPIAPAGRKDIRGFVLLGINPLLTYDSDYQQFIDLLERQCAASLASIVMVEEEKRRARAAARLAAQDHIRLTTKLVETEQQALENKVRFMSMANTAPIAMFHLDEFGDILYANQNWINLTQHPANLWAPMSWVDVIQEEDKVHVLTHWQELLKGNSVHIEMRLKTDYVRIREVYVGGEQVVGPTWTIASVSPELRLDGTVKGVLGCLTDISTQKWIEGFQERRVREALEMKKSQESFMDMICHEARNPLSAMMLCTETIISTMQALKLNPSDKVMVTRCEIDEQLEAAENIMTCAQHQKSIIDDVLTLSKLDAELLALCPVDIQPVEIVRQALRMFDVEMAKNNIRKVFSVHHSAAELGWVRLDSSRLMQILINLLTNAIKFTKDEAERCIEATISATATPPVSSPSGVRYLVDANESHFNSSKQVQDTSHDASRHLVETSMPNSPHDSTKQLSPMLSTSLESIQDDVFIAIEVIDTGCGIKPEAMERLFQKFQQASPRTHVKYGGTGLGLFITRRLTKMLGGAVGAASNASGTTFAFYVKAPRCTALEPGPSSGPTMRSSGESLHDDLSSGRHTPVADSPLPGGFKASASQRNNVLVVEDNLVNQKVLRLQLERLGYRVSVANHGLEALEHILKTRFCEPEGRALDVVLLDIEMPVCNGLDCARRIRQMEQCGQIGGHIPIIGVTANVRLEQQTAALDAGMDLMLAKPFRLKQLTEVLEEVDKRFYT